ncbi:MAG: VanZ family protein [Planctomycetia bacterium]|nr:VanZ family protein [Planctomycetia bacterium]
MSSSVTRRVWQALFALYALLVTAGSMMSNPFAVAGAKRSALAAFYHENLEWCGHFTVYAVLSLFFFAAIPSARRSLRGIAAGAGLLLAYGWLMEALHYFIPGRAMELGDFAQNTAGILAGAGVWLAMLGVWGRSQNESSAARDGRSGSRGPPSPPTPPS